MLSSTLDTLRCILEYFTCKLQKSNSNHIKQKPLAYIKRRRVVEESKCIINVLCLAFHHGSLIVGLFLSGVATLQLYR